MKIQSSGPTYNYNNVQLRKASSPSEDASTASSSFDAMFQNRLKGANAGVSNTTSQVSDNPFGVADADTLISAFRTWKESRQGAGVGNDYLGRIHEQADAFEGLLQKASSEGGYADPIAFIQGLSAQERRSLQQIHSLAEPIAPGRLSKEGALNLLLPPNQLKDIDKNAHSSAILKSTMILGNSLKIPVLAEGVETEAHLNALSKEGCQLVQGFLFGKPMPNAMFVDLLAKQINAGLWNNEQQTAAEGNIVPIKASA